MRVKLNQELMKRPINYRVRVYFAANSRIMIRARWSHKGHATDAEFSTQIKADPDPLRWDYELQRPKKNTTHTVDGITLTARQINIRIAMFVDAIEEAGREFNIKGVCPSREMFKTTVEQMIKKQEDEWTEVSPIVTPENSLTHVMALFLEDKRLEGTCSKVTEDKYRQLMTHVKQYSDKTNIYDINRNWLNGLREWYVKREYSSRTTQKLFVFLKGLLIWANDNGYKISKEALAYKPNLLVPKKRVIFLTAEELQHFHNFDFSAKHDTWTKARDLFCFMCFTGLRYSDLKALTKSNIVGDYIDIYTKKTSDHLIIPLLPEAKVILNRYTSTQETRALPVPSNQKLNISIKEAAKAAGLNRMVSEVKCIGRELRPQAPRPLYEAITNHAARRTFVCIAIESDIPESVIMKITGHKTYQAMLPYIDVAGVTVRKELLSKWKLPTAIEPKKSDTIEGYTIEQLTQLAKLLKQGLV